jgi:Domain of unknown function (DUF5671)
MKMNEHLLEFIEAAKSKGASDDSLVGLLKGQGWPEDAVYAALAAHYQKLTGLNVPTRKRSGAAAKDAFYYLLAFSTLATWTIGFGSLMFTLIENWIADPLAQGRYGYPNYSNSVLASSIASILVAFPIYLFVMRLIIRDARHDPEKLDSGVRKWLTYIALLIAAGVMIGDLVTVLEFFLRGEFTSRFLAKAGTVIVISGAVLWYYLGELKRPASDARSALDLRDAGAAAGASVAIGIAVVLGFLSLGGPSNQRLVQADNKRIENLVMLANQVNNKWNFSNHTLPSNIDALPTYSLNDPVTHQPYEYHAKGTHEYELCATFDRDDRKDTPAAENKFWNHPKGHFCFALDPSEPPAQWAN